MLYISVLAPLVLLLITINDGAIISQSAIRDCTWGDSSEPSSPGGEACKKKMLISMVLDAAQGNTEALYANVDKAQEGGNTKMSVLKKPFRIELRKTAVIVSYRALKLGSANALPKETAISKKNCNDNFYSKSKRLPCGIQKTKSGKRVWDSQGFCCRCDSLKKDRNLRGNQDCGLAFFQKKGSAHCMKMNDLWYDVFELEMPMMQYKITLDVLEFKGIDNVNGTGTKTVNWTRVSTFHLSPSRTIGRSKDGRVVAEVQGSLLGSKAIKDLSAKRLLIPSVRMWPKKKRYPPQYTNGPSDWMLVDSHMVSLSGMECNKVGVNYVGFRRQPGQCESPQGSCFHNQPLQLWNSDNEKRKKKKQGNYMIHNFGKVYHGSHPNKNSFILQFIHDDLHNSFITLRIDASDIVFVKSVSSGRIVETHTTGFISGTTSGSLTVEIVNTGEISSEYTVSVTECSDNMFKIPDETLTLEPGKVKSITFTLRSSGKKGGKKECQVQLLDSNYALLQTAKVNFKVDAACLCFGTCGCACDDEMKSVKCKKETAGPSVFYKPGPLYAIVIVMLLESIGAHGFIAFFGGLLLILGFIKLSCGGILCCRKTKQQEHTERLLKKGVPPKSPLLVQCSGECRGAKAAKARYMRKVQRLKQAGKSPHRLDDWRNTSFECQCKSELADIRFVHVVRAVCFFYFCCFLPFIWIGRCVVWRFFKDTEEKKVKAEQEVLLRAKKKGNMEKYGVIDLATELKKMEEDTEGKTGGKKDDDQSVVTQALVMNIDYSAVKSENAEEAKVSVKNDKESNKKQMVVDGGIQNQTASPQFNWRTEKETKQRKNANIAKRQGKRERESKGERDSVNKSNMKGPKQMAAQNGSQQMNLRAEKDKRDTREKRVKVQKREMASDRKVDREKGNQRGHKSNLKGNSLQTRSHKPADHWTRESLSHTASEHAHPLSSQSSHASHRSKDLVHIKNSGEMESCRESSNKASDHSYHSGSQAGSDNASEHSNLHTSHSIPCPSSHSGIHHSASHTSSQHSVHSQLCQKSSISKHSDSQDTCKSGSDSHSSNGDEKSHSNSDDDDGCSNNNSHSGSEDENEGSHSDSGSHSNSDNEGGCSNESSHSDIDSGGEGDEGRGSHSDNNSRESSSESEGSSDSETEDNTQSGSVESTNHGNTSQ